MGSVNLGLSCYNKGILHADLFLLARSRDIKPPMPLTPSKSWSIKRLRAAVVSSTFLFPKSLTSVSYLSCVIDPLEVRPMNTMGHVPSADDTSSVKSRHHFLAEPDRSELRDASTSG